MPRPAAPYRIAVVGDTAGHAFALRRALQELGVDTATGRVPDDVVVVQVGNLVGPGPASSECVRLVERVAETSPGTWIQLIGSREAQELRGSRQADVVLPEADRKTVARWHATGLARLALAIDTVELGPTLVTHAGMTGAKWEAIGCPPTPGEAADALEAELRTAPVRALTGGDPGASRPKRTTGVAWATPSELLGSWDLEPLPFSQLYGHASPRSWRLDAWETGLPERITARANVDAQRRHTRVAWPEGGQMVCVDPGLGRAATAGALVPLVLLGEIS